MADFDVVMHNYTMNTLAGAGTGGNIGAYGGNEGLEGALGGPMFGGKGIEGGEKTAQGAPGIGGKWLEGLVLNAAQGTIQAIELSNLGVFKAVGLEGTGLINLSGKIPSLFSSKKGK